MGPGLGQDSLRAATLAAGIEVAPVFHAAIGSTSTEAMRLAAEGAPEWTIVATNHQTAGRGRLGRTWETPAGVALTFSVVLRPPLSPEAAALVSLLAAAAMAEAAGAVCKWPNDLLVGDRKVAGLLAEASVEGGELRHLVLGIGVNVTTAAEDLPEGATSLALEGIHSSPPALLGRFLGRFRFLYRPREPRFAEDVVDAYRGRCGTLGRRVRARTTGGRVVAGTALDVDGRGGLVTDVGTVAFGEIEHLEA